MHVTSGKALSHNVDAKVIQAQFRDPVESPKRFFLVFALPRPPSSNLPLRDWKRLVSAISKRSPDPFPRSESPAENALTAVGSAARWTAFM
jgi:hypothetical protein